MPYLEKCLFRSFPHFLIGLFIFLPLSYISCLYILEINSLSAVLFAIIFSHSEGCLFTLLIVSFVMQKLLSSIRSHLFIFAFVSILKEIRPGCSLEELMLKLKLQYFGHLMLRADSLEKILMLGKIEGRRRRG